MTEAQLHRAYKCSSGATIAERLEFYSIPEPNSGCRLWTGAASAGRYGSIHHKGKKRRAHRVAWEEENGPIPDGLDALHKCDVTFCISVPHLFLGTHAQNMADRRSKGRYARQARGHDNGNAVATPEIVRAIRASTASIASLARSTGLGETTISNIRHSRTWKHV